MNSDKENLHFRILRVEIYKNTKKKKKRKKTSKNYNIPNLRLDNKRIFFLSDIN